MIYRVVLPVAVYVELEGDELSGTPQKRNAVAVNKAIAQTKLAGFATDEDAEDAAGVFPDLDFAPVVVRGDGVPLRT